MEQILKQILGELQTLNGRVGNLEQGLQAVQEDVTLIKNELRYVWEDIKRIDKPVNIPFVGHA